MITAGITFFLSFCTPFFTEHRTTSPMDPDGNLLRWPLTPLADIMYRFLAPELSAQLSVAATGSPRVILSLTPTRPVLTFLAIKIYINIELINIMIIWNLSSPLSQFRGAFPENCWWYPPTAPCYPRSTLRTHSLPTPPQPTHWTHRVLLSRILHS